MPGAPIPATETVRLDIIGMTCASCAARIEKRLNNFDGVEATVNYATEQATVTSALGSVTKQQFVDAVSSIGYQASPVVAHSITAADHAMTPTPSSESVKDAVAQRHVDELWHHQRNTVKHDCRSSRT